MSETLEPTYGETPELDYESGLVKLEEEAKKKLENLKRCVIIAISGDPNSGKTRLIRDFILKNQRLKDGKPAIRTLKGPDLEDAEITLEFLNGDFIIYEALQSRELFDRDLGQITDRKADLYINIYNPNLKFFPEKNSDFVIRNEKARIKEDFSRE